MLFQLAIIDNGVNITVNDIKTNETPSKPIIGKSLWYRKLYKLLSIIIIKYIGIIIMDKDKYNPKSFV